MEAEPDLRFGRSGVSATCSSEVFRGAHRVGAFEGAVVVQGVAGKGPASSEGPWSVTRLEVEGRLVTYHEMTSTAFGKVTLVTV